MSFEKPHYEIVILKLGNRITGKDLNTLKKFFEERKSFSNPKYN